MTKQVQIRRGTDSQHTSFTGAEGEISVNTTNDSVHVHDGTTAGGKEMARADGSNVAFTSGTIDGTTIGGTTPAAGTFTTGSFTGDVAFGNNDITGLSKIISDAFQIERTNGEVYIQPVANQGVKLFWNGAERLDTTNTGIDVTGRITTDGITSSGTYEVESTSYFIGNATNGYRFNNAADTENLLVIKDSGNVGIGTSSPDAKFVVSEGASATGFEVNPDDANNKVDLFAYDRGASAYRDIRFDANEFLFRTGSSPTDALTIDASQNVGIGTSSPSDTSGYGRALDIQSPTGAGIYLRDSDAPTTDFGSVAYDAGNGSLTLASVPTTGIMRFVTANTERMRIDSSGNVGIGTNSPQAVIHTHRTGSSESAIRFTNGITGSTSSDGFRVGIDINEDGVVWMHENEPILFGTNNTERMRIRSDGGLAVGDNFAGAATVRLFVNEGSNRYGLYNYATNAAYTNDLYLGQCGRSASSSYNLLTLYAASDREFQFRGDGNAFADGSFSGGGADYAEYFEWDDGNTNNEDRRGYSVVLTNGNKIRKAISSDAATDIIGVISGNPSVVGDAAWNMWADKYNRDDFGTHIRETYTVTEWTETVEDGDDIKHSYETDKIPSDVTAPADATVVTQDANGNTLTRRQLNSSYDDTQTYTSREDRQEWDAVGMMGKLRMRAGQPTGDRWIKMRDIATDDDGNVTIEEWLVR